MRTPRQCPHWWPACPWFPAGCWITAPAPLRDSVALQLRMCLRPGLCPPGCFQESSATSVPSAPRRCPREGPLDLCFLVSLDLSWEELRPHLIGSHKNSFNAACVCTLSVCFSHCLMFCSHCFLYSRPLHSDDPGTAACYSDKVVHYEMSTFLATGQLSGFQFFATVIITAKYIKLYASLI